MMKLLVVATFGLLGFVYILPAITGPVDYAQMDRDIAQYQKQQAEAQQQAIYREAQRQAEIEIEKREIMHDLGD